MADFPLSVVSLTNPVSTDTLASPSHSGLHADANDELEAIETTLGVNPQGGEATVVARLDAADSRVGSVELLTERLDLGQTYPEAIMALNPVAYYRFGEPSGTVAIDQTGSHHATYAGSPTLGATGAITGDADTAATFDGTNDSVNLAHHADFNFTANLTLIAWVKFTAAGAGAIRELIRKGTGATDWFLRRVDSVPNKIQLNAFTAAGNAAVSTADINDGQWHMVVGRYDGATLKIRADDDADTSAVLTGNVTQGGGVLGIGSVSGSDLWWNGSIDEVAIFDTTLTDTQVEQLYTLRTTTGVASRITLLETFTNVKSYGATGNNITDDTAAIDQAIAVAPVGSTVYFPAGFYEVTNLATIDKSLKLRGVGWSSETHAVAGDAAWLTTTPHGGSVIRSTATSGNIIDFEKIAAQFGISDLLVIGPGSGTTTGIKMGASGVYTTRSRIDNVQVSNCALGWDLGFVMDSSFYDPRSKGCETGFSLHNDCNQNVFINIEVQFSEVDGIHLAAATSNKFTGGLLQNIAGGSGLRLSSANSISNIFDNFYCEPTTTPTALIHQVAGGNNRYRDWYIGTDGQTILFAGGGINWLENTRLGVSTLTVQVDVGAIYTQLYFNGYTTLTNNSTTTTVYNPPAAAANADTSGATLIALETEVNQLKATLRAAGLIAP